MNYFKKILCHKGVFVIHSCNADNKCVDKFLSPFDFLHQEHYIFEGLNHLKSSTYQQRTCLELLKLKLIDESLRQEALIQAENNLEYEGSPLVDFH